MSAPMLRALMGGLEEGTEGRAFLAMEGAAMVAAVREAAVVREAAAARALVADSQGIPQE